MSFNNSTSVRKENRIFNSSGYCELDKLEEIVTLFLLYPVIKE